MIKLVSDSTCDLSPALVQRCGVTILPLNIHLGEDAYEDGMNITPEEIFAWSDANKSTPKTSTPSIARASELFAELTRDGSELICFSISGEMSTSGNVMTMAAADLEMEDRIHVVDSENLSTGIGLLIMAAADMIQEGKTAEQILSRLEQLKPKVRASFVVDTLTYLQRGGRCTSVAAIAGSMLHLHPRIVVENGKMHADKKYRGKMNSVIDSYVKDLDEGLSGADPQRVFVTHSGCDQQILDEICEGLAQRNYFQEILVTQAGGVVCSHCGPGTLGVLFIAK